MIVEAYLQHLQVYLRKLEYHEKGKYFVTHFRMWNLYIIHSEISEAFISWNWRIYFTDNEDLLPTEAKQGWAWSVPGWETSWKTKVAAGKSARGPLNQSPDSLWSLKIPGCPLKKCRGVTLASWPNSPIGFWPFIWSPLISWCVVSVLVQYGCCCITQVDAAHWWWRRFPPPPPPYYVKCLECL